MKTIAAIGLCFGLMMLWQKYLTTKYPDYYTKKTAQTTPDPNAPSVDSAATGEGAAIGTAVRVNPVKELEESAAPVAEQASQYKGKNFSFDISNLGMGIRNIKLSNYTTRDQKAIVLAQDSKVGIFSTAVADKWTPTAFVLSAVSENEFVGVANVDGMTIEKKLVINDNDYTVDMTLKATGELKNISNLVFEKAEMPAESIPLMPSYDTETFFVRYGTSTDRLMLREDDIAEQYKKVGIISIDKHYFTRALLDNSKILPDLEFRYKGADSISIARLVYSPVPGSNEIEVRQKYFLGPKDRDILLAVDPRLDDIVNFGVFSFIAHPMMDLMKWFYKLTQNWGVSIILLTIVVRLIISPLHVMSFKSMKKMKDIQPMLAGLKEKHKDQPQVLNQESMRIMKENGVNPIGGCLPMFLQLPVFFALFQVLGNAIELYQAPFFGWITDLSVRDPYYVLPVLMFITMTGQQMLTPTSADPNQKKMMLFVTVLFSAFLIFYPSGLALYIFVGSLFSILQHFLFLRDKSTEKVKVTAKA